MVLFLEDLFSSKVAPTEKYRPGSAMVVAPVGLIEDSRWSLIFKFHRVFSSYVHIPAFARGDQFH